jgi:hypothetical protein
MRNRIHREHANGAHIRAGHFLAPKLVRTLGADERHYLVWGIFRLILGVVQMSFSATAVLCLMFVGPLSSATLICAAIAGIATLISLTLFHGKSGTQQ